MEQSLLVIIVDRLFWISYISHLIWCAYLQQVLLSPLSVLYFLEKVERTHFNVFTVIT